MSELNSRTLSTADTTEGIGAGVLPVLTSSYLATFLAVVRGILVPRMLGPTLQGVINAVNVIIGYAAFSHLGFVHGLNKEMPRLLGRGEEEEADRLKDVAVSAIMILATAAGLAVAGYGLICRGSLGAPTVTGLVVSTGLIIAAQAVLLYQSLLRTHKQFRLIGIIGAVSALLDFALVVGLTWWAGQLRQGWCVYGTLLGLLTKNLVVWIIYARATRYGFRLHLDWRRLRHLFLTGLPITALTFAEQFVRTADRLVILKLLGTPALGLYGAGAMAAGLVYNVPRQVGWVLFPHFLEASGRPNHRHELYDQMLRFTLFLSAAVPALTGAVYVFTPAFLQLVLPKFVEGIDAARGQLAAVAILGLMVPAGTQLVALNREWWLTAVRGIAAAYVLGVSAFLVSIGAGITEIAWCVASACAVYAPGILSMALFAYGAGWRQAGAKVLASLAPVAYCAGAVLLAEHVARRTIGADQKALLFGLTALGVYVVLLVPLLWWMERRFDLRRRIMTRRQPSDTPEIPDDAGLVD
jgi:O-antigen/teichoic acid export membrane protein